MTRRLLPSPTRELVERVCNRTIRLGRASEGRESDPALEELLSVLTDREIAALSGELDVLSLHEPTSRCYQIMRRAMAAACARGEHLPFAPTQLGTNSNIAVMRAQAAASHTPHYDAQVQSFSGGSSNAGATQLGPSGAGSPFVPQTQPPDDAMRWHQADSYGILVDPDREIWHSGHLNDVVITQSGAVLVGADDGGIWAVSSRFAMPVADLDPPGIYHFALGVRTDHVFAASKGGVIYSSDVRPGVPEPLLNWYPVGNTPNGKDVVRIIVAPAPVPLRPRVIAITNEGIWWADVPASYERADYMWQIAVYASFAGTLAVTDSFADGQLSASGPGGTQRLALARSDGSLFWAQWELGGQYRTGVGQLVLRPSSIRYRDNRMVPESDTLKWGAVRLDTCQSHLERAYAIVASNDSKASTPLLLFLRSDNGGQDWREPDRPTLSGAGTATDLYPNGPAGSAQGNYSIALGVSPVDPDTVAIGLTIGPYVTTTAGEGRAGSAAWTFIGETQHVHPDYHSIRFFATNESELLAVCTDGGLAMTIRTVNMDFGSAWSSVYNQRLLTLQFDGTGGLGFGGRISAHARESQLVAGGVQDNGIVYSVLPRPWKRFGSASDGRATFFLNDTFLNNTASEGDPWVSEVSAGRWLHDQGEIISVYGEVPIATRMTDFQNGPPLRAIDIEDVTSPRFRESEYSQQMFAVASEFADSAPWRIFGLFADDDGTAVRWVQIGTVPFQPTSLGSFDGNRVFVGTKNPGFIFSIAPLSGAAPTQMYVPVWGYNSAALISHISFRSDGHGFALVQVDGITRTVVAHLPPGANAWAPSSMVFLPKQPLRGLAVVTSGSDTGSLYVATDKEVWKSLDAGNTWRRASNGLPRNPVCNELRFVRDANGTPKLYLGTRGRSLWVAEPSSAAHDVARWPPSL